MLRLPKRREEGPERVTISVNGEAFVGWLEFSAALMLDGIWSFGVTAPFNSSERSHREFFRPYQYQTVTVELGGDLVMTGTVVNTKPFADADGATVTLEGYATPGVLADCTMPAGAPLEYNKQTLSDILGSVTQAFGLRLQYELPRSAPFEKAALDPEDQVLDFLADLTRQRGGVLSNTADGALRCWMSESSATPIAYLDRAPLAQITTGGFDGQICYSDLTGLAPERKGKRRKGGAPYTAPNPLLTGVLRPHSFRADDLEAVDLRRAVDTKLARMFAAMGAYAVDELPSWRDPNGDLWQPNTTITLHAPDVMIYEPYNFLVRGVGLSATPDSETTSLGVVFPGAFSGEAPERFPWDV